MSENVGGAKGAQMRGQRAPPTLELGGLDLGWAPPNVRREGSR
jgi:hypothetical protein